MKRILKHKKSGLEISFPVKFWNGDDHKGFYSFYSFQNKEGAFMHPNMINGGVEHGNIVHFPTSRKYCIVLSTKQDRVCRKGTLSTPFSSSDLFTLLKETFVENSNEINDKQRWSYCLDIFDLKGAIKVESECIKRNLYKLIDNMQ